LTLKEKGESAEVPLAAGDEELEAEEEVEEPLMFQKKRTWGLGGAAVL